MGSLTPPVGSTKPSADQREGGIPAHPPFISSHGAGWGARTRQASTEKDARQSLRPTRSAPRRTRTPALVAKHLCPSAPPSAPSLDLRSPTWGLSQGKDPPPPPCRPTLRTQSRNSRPVCLSASTSGAGSFVLSCSEPQRCFTQQAQMLPFNRNLRPTPSRTQNRSASRRKSST